MQEKRYNYLIGKAEELSPSFNINKRIDPDSGCKELYDDFIEAYFGNEKCNRKHNIVSIENKKQKFGSKPEFYTLFINGSDYLLSMDYIGPSVYWARDRGLSDSDIIKFLSVCRTIGGHVAWPRGRDIKVKINVARAGKDGLYDRIDWTLALIKVFYETKELGKNQFVKNAMAIDFDNLRGDEFSEKRFDRMYEAFCCAQKWFELFGSFPGFCEQYKLVGKNGFVDENFEVRNLAPWYPFLPDDYSVYIDNVCDAVNTRNDEVYNS